MNLFAGVCANIEYNVFFWGGRGIGGCESL